MKRWIAAPVALLSLLAMTSVGWRLSRDSSDFARVRDQARKLKISNLSSSSQVVSLSEKVVRQERQLARLERDLNRVHRFSRARERLADRTYCFGDLIERRTGFLRGPLRADVDGDGATDRIYAAGQRSLLGRTCRYYLVAETASGVHKTRVHGDVFGIASAGLSPFFYPRAAADLDDRPGVEVLAVIHQGAAVVSGAIYSFAGDQFTLLEPSPDEDPLFEFEGSVCCGGELDCEDGFLVHTGYGRHGSGPRYNVTRRFYRVEPSRLVLVRTSHSRATIHERDPLPGTVRPALARCDGYVAYGAVPRN